MPGVRYPDDMSTFSEAFRKEKAYFMPLQCVCLNCPEYGLPCSSVLNKEQLHQGESEFQEKVYMLDLACAFCGKKSIANSRSKRKCNRNTA